MLSERFLEGTCDTHVHFAPDMTPHLRSGPEIIYAARSAAMRCIVLKSHYAPSYPAAAAIGAMLPGITVLGGIALNAAVGGICPEAVSCALAMGARIVWMPTVSSESSLSRSLCGRKALVPVFQSGGYPAEGLEQVLDLIARHDAILATGHLPPRQTWGLACLAQRMGVRRILVTHPEADSVSMDLDMQQALAAQGVFFERCFLPSQSRRGASFRTIARHIRLVGAQSTVLATDLGPKNQPMPALGLLRFCEALERCGVEERELDIMTKDTPARLLGLN